jgi:hypothetical protein
MKPLFLISAPVDTYSGYGARSRDLIKAIIGLDQYDVKILPQRWGNTPWNFIEDHKEEWQFLKEHYYPFPQLHKQPEIWMQITVPNEFTPVGKYNIGVTAGIETTGCHHSWIEGVNRMNLVLTSSEHAKKVFLDTKFEQRDQATNQVVGVIETKTPIEVIFEGADLEKYKEILPEDYTTNFPELDTIPEDFCYLVVGHWLQGDIGEDRKNIGMTIKAFLETFKNRTDKPALVLKTSHGGSSYMDRYEILKKIDLIKKTVKSKDLPNIYLLHGELTDEDINNLYNHPKIKAMVTLTKGEGFGRPLLEFSLVKKPIIATNWSGHVDFLDVQYTTLLGGQLTNVHPSAANSDMLLQETAWFSVNTMEVGAALSAVRDSYDKHLTKAKRQYHRSKTKFSFEAMQTDLGYSLTRNIPEFPKQVQLKLPTLKKIELPKIKKPEADVKG